MLCLVYPDQEAASAKAGFKFMRTTSLGASTTFMSAGQVYPAIGEDMGYLVWRKRNCCAL